MAVPTRLAAWPAGPGLDSSSWRWEKFLRTAAQDHADLQTRFDTITQAAIPTTGRSSGSNPLTRFRRLRDWLNAQLVKRGPAIRALLASAIAFEPVLLVGPPGAAKGALVQLFSEGIGARRLPARDDVSLPERKGYFEIQLTATTDVDEVMGGIDLDAFKRSIVRRRTDRMMVHSLVVFIDEVFRGSGAVLNSLLMLLNERAYTDAGTTYPADSLVIVGATNTVPSREENAAFYSRFPIRAYCPMVSRALDGTPTRTSRGGHRAQPAGSPTTSALLDVLRKGTVLEERRCTRMLSIPASRSTGNSSTSAPVAEPLGDDPIACLLDLLVLHRYVRAVTNVWVDPDGAAARLPGANSLPTPRWSPVELVGIYATMTQQPGLATGITTGLRGRYQANDRTLARLARILVADSLLQGTLVAPGAGSEPLDPDHLFLLTCTAEEAPNPERNPEALDYTGDLQIVFDTLGL